MSFVADVLDGLRNDEVKRVKQKNANYILHLASTTSKMRPQKLACDGHILCIQEINIQLVVVGAA